MAGYFQNEPDNYSIITFYKFTPITNPEELKEKLLDLCTENEIKGTILVAREGINATVAGSNDAVTKLVDYLESLFTRLDIKKSCCEELPFYRMKVKVKDEIVTMGLPHIHPDEKTGRHLDPEEWNRLLEDPDVLLIDTRNHYEYEIGTFPKAISPNTNSFTEFPQYIRENLSGMKDMKIAMFCTGGIRCEKASSYLLDEGFENVYQLQGGILQYLLNVPADENLWQGECFVFDQRVAVDANLQKGKHELCYACRMPVSPEDMQSDKYQEGISCPRCFENLTEEKRANLAERQKQVNLAKSRNRQHIGVPINK